MSRSGRRASSLNPPRGRSHATAAKICAARRALRPPAAPPHADPVTCCAQLAKDRESGITFCAH
eukprot:5029867-Prymnesium_polylepis.1